MKYFCLILFWVVPLACVSGLSSYPDQSGDEIYVIDHRGGNLDPEFMKHWLEQHPRKNSLAFDSKTLVLGKGLYERHCVLCHGKNGSGQTEYAKSKGISPRNLEVLAEKLKKYQLKIKITSGNPKMPNWSDLLTDGEVDAIASYIVSSLGPKP